MRAEGSSRLASRLLGENSPTPGQVGISCSRCSSFSPLKRSSTPTSPSRARRRGLCARSRAVLGVGSRCPLPLESIARCAPRGLAPKASSASRAPEDAVEVAKSVRKSPLTRARPRVPAKTWLTYLQRRARAWDPPPKATGARARDIGDDVDRLRTSRRARPAPSTSPARPSARPSAPSPRAPATSPSSTPPSTPSSRTSRGRGSGPSSRRRRGPSPRSRTARRRPSSASPRRRRSRSCPSNIPHSAAPRPTSLPPACIPQETLRRFGSRPSCAPGGRCRAAPRARAAPRPRRPRPVTRRSCAATRSGSTSRRRRGCSS